MSIRKCGHDVDDYDIDFHGPGGAQFSCMKCGWVAYSGIGGSYEGPKSGHPANKKDIYHNNLPDNTIAKHLGTHDLFISFERKYLLGGNG